MTAADHRADVQTALALLSAYLRACLAGRHIEAEAIRQLGNIARARAAASWAATQERET